MKKMYRLFTAVLLISAFAACTMLAGCGSKDEQKSEDGSEIDRKSVV